MAVSQEYREYVLEQLSYVAPVRARNMFGGVGLWVDERFCAIIANDALYFKVDDSNQPDYEARGMGRFGPLRYYQVPDDVLDDPARLREWVAKAIAVAARKHAG